ncbi:intraflagellar transport protein 88 homolog [Anopheles bellator]|uniref:intraflagellar transport protein 88 homolog n=1 Tax=Anopheles bellator TaxID=139047 RepID=UPI002649F3BE|nr:intraflagellar transport protein 88 homolog [Anopheles bellator]
MAKYYNISATWIDCTSMVFMVIYIAAVFPISYVMDVRNMRQSAVIGTVGTALGAWVKVFSADPSQFKVVLLGQTVSAIAQVFLLSIPSRLSATWFSPEEASSVCAFGVFGAQLGIAIGFFLTPMVIVNSDDPAAIGVDLQVFLMGVAGFSTMIACMVIAIFKSEPPFAPSHVQALQRTMKPRRKDYWPSVARLMRDHNYLILVLAYGINSNASYEYINELIKSDELHNYERKLRQLAEKNILISANLISTIIDDYFNDGYSWCVETIKNSYFSTLASDLELKKAVIYLKQDDFQQAIDTLKYFEKKESNIAINAAINLSFIYILKKDVAAAETYAEAAKKIDSYCPAAFINSGVCFMLKNDYESAKLMFTSALDIDSTSFEALYNMGLIFKKLADHNTALLYFRKIISSLGHEQHPEVLYQIAQQYDLLGDVSTALEYYLQLLSLAQQDHKIIQRIGELYEKDGERQQAYHYHHESYRIYPIESSVINWLCSHYIELQVVEKAIGFYEKAILRNPQDPYYLLRIAGCYRRIGNQQKSMNLFRMIHEHYPENTDCLRALMHLTQSQGNSEAYEKFASELQKLEKQKEVRQRIGNGRPPTSSNSRLSSGEYSSARAAVTASHEGYQAPGTASGHHSTGQTSKSADVSPDYSNNFAQAAYTYGDPLGPPQERPRTGVRRNLTFEDESDEEINTYDLLPV